MGTMESRIVRCAQGTYDWHMARCCNVTASEVHKVMAFRKRGENKGEPLEEREKYMSSIISEILSGEPDMEGYVTAAMNRGSDEEPLAAAAYEMAMDVETRKVGFVLHPTIQRLWHDSPVGAGASPDRLVGNDGLLELKNPKGKTHIHYLRNQVLPKEYEPQVMFQLACTEREWCDFMSYDSRLPPRFRLRTDRIYRNEKRIAEINAAVEQFLDEAFEVIVDLERLYPESGAPAPLKEKLRQSITAEDGGLTTEDLPDWARNMGHTL